MKQKITKSITEILHEMVYEVKKIGRKPRKIKLTEKDYQQLFDELSKNTNLHFPAGYEIVPNGVVYHREPMRMRIWEFMGLPVEIDDQTMVVWL